MAEETLESLMHTEVSLGKEWGALCPQKQEGRSGGEEMGYVLSGKKGKLRVK